METTNKFSLKFNIVKQFNNTAEIEHTIPNYFETVTQIEVVHINASLVIQVKSLAGIRKGRGYA